MVRIVHYLNQFFGQIGGEDRAGSGPFVREGAVGPGTLIEKLLAGQGKVIATVICGDNYFAEGGDRASQEVFSLIKDYPMDIFMAGPAFNAGRYGIACGEICKYVKEKTGMPAITGMFHENPGVELYKRHVHIIGTTDNAAGMREAMSKMLSLAMKLYRRQSIGRPEEEGYIPQGIKKTIFSDRLASERAIELLLKKLRGEAYHTEVLFSELDSVPPAAPVANMKEATIALVTEGGLVPRGNPDGLESSRATKYVKYKVEEIEKEGSLRFQSIHIGFDTNFINEDPNRLVPVDALRELESEGRFKKIHSKFFVTTGVGTTMENARKIGERMAAELHSAGVSAVIITSTWGTGTRCGAVLEKEIERAGIPAVLITTLMPIAEIVRANRIAPGIAITHPLGDPRLSRAEEKSIRKHLLDASLDALMTIPKEEPLRSSGS